MNVVAGRVGLHLHVEGVIAGSTSPVEATEVAESASRWRPGQQAFTFFRCSRRPGASTTSLARSSRSADTMAEKKPAKKTATKAARSTSGAGKATGGFTEEERAA